LKLRYTLRGVVLCCTWCCAPPPPGPPPPPQPQVVIIENNSGTSNPVIGNAATVSNYKELKSLEYREGEKPSKYYVVVPEDVEYNGTTQICVKAGGVDTNYTIVIPETIQRGEKIIVLCPPAPVI
jgi:hypothetical protein